MIVVITVLQVVAYRPLVQFVHPHLALVLKMLENFVFVFLLADPSLDLSFMGVSDPLLQYHLVLLLFLVSVLHRLEGDPPCLKF